MGSSDNLRAPDDDGDDGGYETIASLGLLSAASQPAASSGQLFSLQPAKPTKLDKPVATSVPVKKWHSSENDNRQKLEMTRDQKTTEPCKDRQNFVMERKESVSSSLSATLTSTQWRWKQPSQTADEMIYEVIDSIPNLGARAEDQTTKPQLAKPGGESWKTPRPERQTDPQYTVPRKKQPPPTMPKSAKGSQVISSPPPLADADCQTAVCIVKPVISSVDSETSTSPSPTTASAAGHERNRRWKSASEVPTDLQHLSVEEVGQCMELLHLPKLAADFRSQDVDGQLLVSIVSEKVLTTDFNCRAFDAKKVVQFVKNGWRPNE